MSYSHSGPAQPRRLGWGIPRAREVAHRARGAVRARGVVRMGFLALVGWAVTLSPAPALAQQSQLVVTAEWLAERQDDENLVLLQVGSEAAFEEGHIPGARPLPLQRFAPEVDGMSTEMPEPDALREALELAGVSSDSRIVVYSASNPPQLAARLYLTLEHFGLGEQAVILDGGLRGWEAAGRPVASGPIEVERGSLHDLRPDSDLLADHAEVQDRLTDSGTAIVDARDPGFWTGEQQNQQRAPRAGRIPGAHNVPFRTLVDESGHLLELEELGALFASAGVEPGQSIIAYCHVGQQASLIVLAGRLLGYEVKLYDGSYEDWSARLDLPVIVD